MYHSPWSYLRGIVSPGRRREVRPGLEAQSDNGSRRWAQEGGEVVRKKCRIAEDDSTGEERGGESHQGETLHRSRQIENLH